LSNRGVEIQEEEREKENEKGEERKFQTIVLEKLGRRVFPQEVL
jgi:hypothetical protein